jgi:hypothetical protein
MSKPYEGDSATFAVPGLKGVNSAGGDAVVGQASGGGRGLAGTSDSQAGVYGASNTFVGVWGESQSPASAGQPGVFGISPHWQGVHGESTDQVGVYGVSKNFVGVWGESQSPASAGQPGVFGISANWQGVHGESTDQVGVFGASKNFVGVWGESATPGQPGIFGKGPGLAGSFSGNVLVTGTITATLDVVLGSDCAEQFDVAETQNVEPGSVMVLCGENSVRVCDTQYDKRAAGVVSGAGDFKPGLILGGSSETSERRKPLALAGKVYCKVDADFGSIDVGDLLTTSSTPGCAMKAGDRALSFGAVIGKALRPLQSGRGLIPILVSLQ